YRDGQRELHCVFVDLEKAYDRVPREELWYCMRKSGVAEKYLRVVQDMYERSRTMVRCAVGQTEEFKVEVGLHQGSALSPFLFAIVMDQLSEEVRQESPWTMMFADDIVICSKSREQVEENLERWRFALERRGMKVSRSKTEYMCVNEREGSGTIRLQGEEMKKVQEFKYLGSTVQSNGECGKEVKKRVQAGWNGWRKVSGVLCDRKISVRIKGKVYRTVVRPAMLYGLETVSLRKRQESELELAELKMLRQMGKSDPSSTAALLRIAAIRAHSKGFACASTLGEVCLYEKTGEYSYIKAAEIRIPQDPCSNEPSLSAQQEIKSKCLSPSEETLAISTQQGQIYHVNLTSVEISQFTVHSGSITGLLVSSSKHLFATSSKDNSVRIWNYKANFLELYKTFPEEPNCISLHPNGLSILVGFSDKVCLMNLLVDEFHTVQEFDIHNCSVCVFNHDGNMFAAVRDNLISIINIRTGDKCSGIRFAILGTRTIRNREVEACEEQSPPCLACIKAFGVAKVQFVKWSEDDRYLVSFGTDGAVYEWSVLSGEIFREVASCDMAYTAISMTHSGPAVFVGTATGTVRGTQYQLEESSWIEHQVHSGPIAKMVVTPDDQYLVTASEDGSLLIWTITDLEGYQLSTVKETCFT
ncbi:hypothetical protein QTP86_028894, partial [Hemibagrus guttatus]